MTEQTKTKKPITKKWWFWVIIVVVAIGVIANLGGNKDKDMAASNPTGRVQGSTNQETSTPPTEGDKEKQQPEQKPEQTIDVTVTAEELAKAYDDNEVKGNQLYKNKLAEITGKIDSIGEVLGQTYIVLSAEEDFAVTQVQCNFKDKDEIAKIAEMSKGDEVTVVGTIDGKSLNVSVNKCKFK
ncbi:putative nucleic acid binding protein [Anaerobacterium chartisolvens]|uniref:Putative nucleic acid binding protein n=1 Tax=Anaerobacterium chartisolvens TaxID=1297424 RepID=A0A369BJU3_9FIRM|nr:hypothetical protein [Anaerobacterium chartisolvens]RCX20846.1 putative nucleic acid binding protein [Anaerobacterium chartisolvens]